MCIYYVYAYIRHKDSKVAKTGTPYYIGKGKNDRAYAKHGRIHVPLDRTNIIFLETNLTEIGALALERRMIKWYGKVIDHTGILENLSEGGEGTSGFKHTVETKQKIRNKRLGIPRALETKEKLSIVNKNKIFSNEHRQNLRDAKVGGKHSLETKRKMSEASKGKPKSAETLAKKAATTAKNKALKLEILPTES